MTIFVCKNVKENRIQFKLRNQTLLLKGQVKSQPVFFKFIPNNAC